MRLRINNEALPGYTVERTIAIGSEIHRGEVFDPDGDYIGTIVYVRRQRKGASVYGWRREKAAPQSRLMSQTDAVRQMAFLGR